MIYQSTDTRMTSQKNCFLRFVQHGAVLKMFARLFRIEQEKSLVGAVYKQEKEETKAKVFLSI